MGTVIYREYQPADFAALSDIVRVTWEHDKLCTPKIAVLLSDTYLRFCLAEQTFTRVAEFDGKAAGVIMGHNLRKTHGPLLFCLQAWQSLFRLSLSKEGRRAWKFFRKMDLIYEQLLADSSSVYQGELSFLAVRPDCRGRGIGKELFALFQQYMEKENIKHYYVFTDTSCNYGFYESLNMQQCGMQTLPYKQNNRLADCWVFIYENTERTGA